MNRLLWITLLGLTAATACTKTNPPYRQLTGDWKLTGGNYGGFAGGTYTIPADSLFVLSLNADSSFMNKRNGRITESGTYHIVPLQQPYPGGKGIEFSTSPGFQFWIQQFGPGGDSLTVANIGIEGAPGTTYVKIVDGRP